MRRQVIAWLAGCVGLVLVTAAAGPAAHGAEYTVETATITVDGAQKRVLTDGRGRTLYYLSTDTPARSTCTGGCAKVWIALLSASTPTSEDPLPGALALVKTEHGSQVSYNGHLLYTYSGDRAPHQANGQGVGGKWWVATVDLTPMASGAPGLATHPTHKDYGNGGGW
jgi:predicted lipoprotein with Yx(FWY)xxD motif